MSASFGLKLTGNRLLGDCALPIHPPCSLLYITCFAPSISMRLTQMLKVSLCVRIKGYIFYAAPESFIQLQVSIPARLYHGSWTKQSLISVWINPFHLVWRIYILYFILQVSLFIFTCVLLIPSECRPFSFRSDGTFHTDSHVSIIRTLSSFLHFFPFSGYSSRNPFK